MKKLNESFSSLDSLIYLVTKIDFLFHTQQYMISALKAAQLNSGMIGVLGREGMGKSSAIAQYQLNNPNVYYVRIGQSYMVSNFLDEMIFQKSGIYPASHISLFIKVKMLSHSLSKTRDKKIIIVDDAGKLTARALGFFHELRDNTIYTTAFAFVGLPYFQTNLLSAKKRGTIGIAEFYRRIQSWYSIPSLKENELVTYGIKKGLDQEQILQLKNTRIETLSELEINTSKIKLNADLESSTVIKSIKNTQLVIDDDVKDRREGRPKKMKTVSKI